MSDSLTSNIALTLPAVDVEDPATPWGAKVNSNFTVLDSKWSPSTPTAQIVGSGQGGTSTAVARADHVHPMSHWVDADIASGAAIAYSKLALTGHIVNADLSASAAIAYSKLTLTGSIVNADVASAAAIAYSKLSLTGSIVNADLSSSAAIARSKLATLTASRAMVTDGSGNDTVASVTATELGYVSGVTSAIQTQLDSKLGGVNQPVNIAINGGMEVWQRGTSFSSPADGVYTADRWRMSRDGTPTFTVAQESTNIDKGGLSMKLDVTAISGSPTKLSIRQIVENGTRFNGSALTLSVRVKCSVAGKITCALSDDNGAVISSANVGTGWETLTATISSVADTSSLNIFVGFVSGSGITPSVCTTYIDSVMLVTGTTACSFTGEDPSLEIMRCQRYYARISGNVASEQCGNPYCFGTTNWLASLQFPERMRAAPTITATNATSFNVLPAAGTPPTAVASMSFDSIGPASARLLGTVASGLVAGNATNLFGGTSCYIELNAEM